MTIRGMFASGAAIASLLALAACGGDPSLDTAGKGQVAIVMSATGGNLASGVADPSLATGSLGTGTSGEMADSTSHDTCQPTRQLQAATVTFSSILARTLDGKLIDTLAVLPVTVDVLKLEKGKPVTLPIGFLPPGTYDQLVVVMTKFEVTLLNGTKIAVTPPGGGWTAIIAVSQPFTVTEGATTTITIKFRTDLSFGCGLGKWEFHPRFDCDD
jgi:hypothetical protein